MKRNASAQGGEGKLESRFAALTSGLLARKGQAAPSNSPIIDPAEETDAFAIEPTRKVAMPTTPGKAAPADKAAPKAVAPAPKESEPKKSEPKKSEPQKPAAQIPAAQMPAPQKTTPEKTTTGKAAPPTTAPAKAQAAKPEPANAKGRAVDPSLTIINERSFEAGYPDNPTPEEIAALEAEADEVVSYFENFGTADELALEKDDFYGDADETEDDEDAMLDLNEDDLAEAGFDDGDDALSPGPWAMSGTGASVPPVAAPNAFEVKAGVTVQLTAREFMRLSLGAAELGQTAQELIAEAIEDYLDARGVLSLGGCSCLQAVMKSGPGEG